MKLHTVKKKDRMKLKGVSFFESTQKNFHSSLVRPLFFYLFIYLFIHFAKYD